MNGFERLGSLLRDVAEVAADPAARDVLILVLAIVFAWSGLAKLRRPHLTAFALLDFGIVGKLRPRLAVTLGSAEVGLAIALVGAAAGSSLLRVAATGAATVGLLGFCALIARALQSGRDFPCMCFGDPHAAISRSTLARTAALALLALGTLVSALAVTSMAEPDGVLVELVVAGALTASSLLLAALPKLVRWNDDPFGVKRPLIKRR